MAQPQTILGCFTILLPPYSFKGEIFKHEKDRSVSHKTERPLPRYLGVSVIRTIPRLVDGGYGSAPSRASNLKGLHAQPPLLLRDYFFCDFISQQKGS